MFESDPHEQTNPGLSLFGGKPHHVWTSHLCFFVFACWPNTTTTPKTKNEHGPYELTAATRTPINPPLKDSLSFFLLVDHPYIHFPFLVANQYSACLCLLPRLSLPVPFQCPSQTPSSGHLLRASTRFGSSTTEPLARLAPPAPLLPFPLSIHKATPQPPHTTQTPKHIFTYCETPLFLASFCFAFSFSPRPP